MKRIIGNIAEKLVQWSRGAAEPVESEFRLDPEKRVWDCKIGYAHENALPRGADAPMRRAVEKAFEEVTGQPCLFIFSGWGGRLTEDEAQVIEWGGTSKTLRIASDPVDIIELSEHDADLLDLRDMTADHDEDELDLDARDIISGSDLIPVPRDVLAAASYIIGKSPQAGTRTANKIREYSLASKDGL